MLPEIEIGGIEFDVYNEITGTKEDGVFYIGQNGKLYKKITTGYDCKTMLIEVFHKRVVIRKKEEKKWQL